MNAPVVLSIASPNSPVAFSLGRLDVRWYAIFILVGIIAAISLGVRLAERRGYDPNVLYDMAPWTIFLSIAGARLYYVMLEWEYFRNQISEALNLRSGGLSIHGALIAGIVVVFVFCRMRQQSFLGWADLILPGVALGQAIGRWGNWANQEAFGTPSSLPWAVQIDPRHRPTGYESQATFHPTFLYESLFNLFNAVVLSWLVVRLPRFKRLRAGDIAGLYLINYGVIRFFIERIRTDSLYIGPLPAAYWLSFALIAGGAAMMLIARRYPASSSNA